MRYFVKISTCYLQIPRSAELLLEFYFTKEKEISPEKDPIVFRFDKLFFYQSIREEAVRGGRGVLSYFVPKFSCMRMKNQFSLNKNCENKFIVLEKSFKIF